MKRALLRIDPLDDIIFSRSSASMGGHRGHDYIPGAALLGWAARNLYGTLSRTEALEVFHSGRVRFGDARPLSKTSDGTLVATYPMPRCLYELKAGPPAMNSEGRICRISAYVFDRGTPLCGQPKPLDSRHVATDGSTVAIDKNLRMKTAVDPTDGRARRAALFGYEAIRAGQPLLASIEADDDVAECLWQRVIERFDKGVIRLGRSRRTEFGRCHCRLDNESDIVQPRETPGHRDDERTLRLWLISDLALCDDYGRPVLSPAPAVIHHALVGRLDPRRTFLRVRRYAPYNGHLRAHDIERSVIERGSVLTFCLDQPPSKDVLKDIARGIGLHREQGLGVVWVNPPMLDGSHPQFSASDAIHEGGGASPQPCSTESDRLLADLLKARAGERKAVEDSRSVLLEIVKDLESHYRAVRRRHGVARGEPCGPGNSQWGRVREAAVHATDCESLKKNLESILKDQDPDWSLDDGTSSFAKWLRDTVVELCKGETSLDVPSIVARLAERARGIRERDAREHSP